LLKQQKEESSSQYEEFPHTDDNIILETDRRQSQRIIFQVDEGHKSPYTEYKYRVDFNHFLNFIRIHDLDVLLDLGKEAIQELVIKYTRSLRDNAEKKYSRSTVNNRVAAILYFLDNNDIELNKRKIRRYFPSDESVKDDRPYTAEEIQKVLSVCDLREKAMILLMASSGVRIGALSSIQIDDSIKQQQIGDSMQIGDLTPLTFNGLTVYKVQVYARSKKDRYFTFCTPECAKAIQEYLEYRKRSGEDPLKDRSPLFRKHFNKQDPFTINVPKPLTDDAVMKAVDGVLKKSGIKSINSSEVMRSHAFRKGFMSICERSGMKSINVKMLLGHNIGVSGHYYRPTETDLLEDYIDHAADALTISSEARLKKQIERQELEHSEEWHKLKEEMNELKKLLDR